MHRHDRGKMTPAFLSLCLIGFGAHFGVALIQIGFIGCVILGLVPTPSPVWIGG